MGRSNSIAIPTSTGMAISASRTLLGWSASETGGANPSHVVLRAGSATGAIVGIIHCATGLTDNFQIDDGVWCQDGIHATVSGSGTQLGVLYVR